MSQPIFWSPGVTLEQIEEQVIIRAYQFFQKNKTATANALGISIRTLDHKLEKYEDDRRKQSEQVERDKLAAAEFLKRQRGIVGQDFYNGYGAPISPGAAPVRGSEKEKRAEDISSAAPGLRVESASDATAEPAVSVSERSEVQKVLPAQAPARHSGRAR